MQNTNIFLFVRSLSLTVPEMTYNVFSGTLNPTHFTSRTEEMLNCGMPVWSDFRQVIIDTAVDQ